MKDELTIRGKFVGPDGSPIAGATVHDCFLGDPPSNCGTVFDLEEAPAHTDSLGGFEFALSRLDWSLSFYGPAGTWKRGCFLVLAVKDSRTIGYTIASGEELAASPVELVALPSVDIQGRVVDEVGQPIPGAEVIIWLYLLFVGRGPYPNAPVNFWLARGRREREGDPQTVADLRALTNRDGRFVIPHAPAMPGMLSLRIAHPNYATLETDYYPYQPALLLRMQPGGAVRLKLTLPDGSPAERFAFDFGGKPEGGSDYTHRSGVSDRTGHCDFTRLPPGSYTIYYLGGGQSWAVPAIIVHQLHKGEQRQINSSTGVLVDNVPNNTIGGTSPPARNVVGDNDDGLDIIGTGANGNVVEGNYLGTDGTQVTSSGKGIFIIDGSNNVLGGTAPGAGNVIASKTTPGIKILGDTTTLSGNVVQGNYIGPNAAGTGVLSGLGNNGVDIGVWILGLVSNTTIGGITPSARNVISGWYDTQVEDDSQVTGDVVEGNYIGTDAAGSRSLGSILLAGLNLGIATGNAGGMAPRNKSATYDVDSWSLI